VRRLWYPLGYNVRPVRLHAIARETVARYGGRLPDDREALRALPGVGRYTAGAVLSFAFGRDAAVLDTNVRRVLGRVFFGPRRLKRLRGEARMWDLAEALVPAGRGYDFNQALMDFGATWCTPRRSRAHRAPDRAPLDPLPHEVLAVLREGPHLARPASQLDRLRELGADQHGRILQLVECRVGRLALDDDLLALAADDHLERAALE